MMKLLIQKGIFLLLGLLLTVILGSQSAPALENLNLSTRTRITQIEQRWQGEYEDYFGVSSTTPPLTTRQIKANLNRLRSETGKKLALVYVFPNPEELELVLVIPERPLIRKVLSEAPRSVLLSVVNDFKEQVTRPANTREYLNASRQLYQWIIAPLEANLQSENIDTLIFCAGASLRSLPFAALNDGQRFLVEKYSLGVIPAFSLVNRSYQGVHSAQVLAMGASEFQDLQTLPAVPIELSAIAEDSWQGKVFLNQEFTLNNLRSQLESQSFAIVHLATHAEFRPGAPDNSFIQLWQNDRLNLNQLRQLDWRNLPVELLVLSACQTALGDPQAELGFAGLSFQAGVKSSLASLWRVSDVGTLALMQEFYWQLAHSEGITKAEALRQAQIAMLSGRVYIHNGQLHSSGRTLTLPSSLGLQEATVSGPYHWAAFMLVGSPW